ncbi:MAG: uroporphyrinogen decarboxylase [Proteobacteria bacterium]|nr:uroporphyrinogen decarboxylase [Pseudomonadota bacterium]
MSPLLVQALDRQPLARPPVWLMRQAGRYLPEYRKVRANFPNFMEFCLNPAAATEVTLQPLSRFKLDAAIIFADILTIPHVLGHPVTFTEGHGPRVTPFNSPHQLAGLQAHLADIPNALAPVFQTVKQTRAALPEDKAVIGFCGGPFTLACYMLDEKPSLGIANTLAFAAAHPQSFTQLLSILTQACASYLGGQISAGANAVQIFESWALACPPPLWQQAVHQPLTALAAAVRLQHPQTPIIAFPRGASQPQLLALAEQPQNPFAALSLATEVDLSWASQKLQPHVALQGNLDPLLLTQEDPAPMLASLTAMLNTAATNPGYVVNLGHGLTPQTLIPNVEKLVEAVRTWRA